VNNKSLSSVFLAVILMCSILVSAIRFGAAQDSTLSEPSFTISGYILDSSGHGIVGAHISFCVPDIVPSVVSDSSGYYVVHAPAGTYHVNVWPPFDSNYVNFDQQGFVVNLDISKNITLPTGFKVSGYVFDTSGKPVKNTVVLLDNYLSGWFSKDTGYYFAVAPAGTYTLSVWPANGVQNPPNFPTYYEYNVVVNGNLAKNITVGGSSPTPSPSPTSNFTISDSDSWPMFHHDPAHSGYSESTGPLANQVLWKFQTGSSVESSPAVVGGIVYVGALWNGKNGFVYALNASTGSKIWEFATDSGVESSAAVVNGVVYIGTYLGQVYALNAYTGSLLWLFNAGGSVFPSPAVVDGVVYVGSATGYMYALNAANGSPLWSYHTNGAILSSPAVVDGVVYFGSEDQNFYALRASDGSQIWHYTAGGFIDGSPVVADGIVYFGSRDGYVYALDAAYGSQIWSFRPLRGNYGSYYYSTPAVANGVIYVGGYDSSIYALNATSGSIFWEFRTGGYIFSSPVVAGAVVYVGSYDGNVYALDAVTGSKIWSYQTGGKMRSSCAVVNGALYVGSDDGYLYALGSSSTQPTPSYKISGYILDSNGHGIAGAHIIFNVLHIPAGYSDSSGYYSISAPAGTYHVNVWPPFDSNYIHYDEPGFVVGSDMTKNITLYSGYKVSGYVSFSNGTPVVGAAVIFRNSANTWFGSGWFSTSEGYYFLNVPAGTYTIDAHPRTGYNYSGPTTDFPPYYEYNFTVNGDTVKNITVGGSPPTSSLHPEPTSSPESSLASSSELSPFAESSSAPPATVTPVQRPISTNEATMTLLEIVLCIVIVAAPIVVVISVCLLFYSKKRNR